MKYKNKIKLSTLILILLTQTNSTLITDIFRPTSTYTFQNKTNEFLDVEISLENLATEQNRFAERIAPGETIQIETSGCMKYGFNIWRTYRSRDYTGLLGVWKIDDTACSGGFTIENDTSAWGNFQPAGNILSQNAQDQVWNKLNENDQKIIKEGGYKFSSMAPVNKSEFLQGSGAAWTKAIPSKVRKK